MPPKLVNSAWELFAQDRPRGKHVTSAIYTVMQTLYPSRFGNDEGPNQVRLDLGNALEHAIGDALARRYPDRYASPGVLELDGVFGTPDLWDVHRWATIEIKLTWASSNRAEDPEDPWFWRYWTQLKAYCHMAGQDTGFLVVVFLNGNYRRDDPEGSQPQLRMWEDTWSPEELAETWGFVKGNAEEE